MGRGGGYATDDDDEFAEWYGFVISSIDKECGFEVHVSRHKDFEQSCTIGGPPKLRHVVCDALDKLWGEWHAAREKWGKNELLLQLHCG